MQGTLRSGLLATIIWIREDPCFSVLLCCFKEVVFLPWFLSDRTPVIWFFTFLRELCFCTHGQIE